jgi:hypothetical protein
MKARNFIKPGEEILVLMTDGTLLEFGKDNTALTGNWEINVDIDESIKLPLISDYLGRCELSQCSATGN